LAVELAHEDSVFADRHTSVVPAAAHGADGLVEVRRVLPENLAGVDRQRERVVGAGGHIRDALVNDRLPFTGVLGRGARSTQTRTPHTFELRDVGAIDRSKW
jgi:hypothetical protein